jgi:hypothetical protein
MRKSSKFIVIAGALAALAVPSAAMADEPTGEVVVKAPAKSEHASSIGVQSSNIKQNGQFVSGQENVWNMDQTTTPGSRADTVQASLSADNGIGRDR